MLRPTLLHFVDTFRIYFFIMKNKYYSEEAKPAWYKILCTLSLEMPRALALSRIFNHRSGNFNRNSRPFGVNCSHMITMKIMKLLVIEGEDSRYCLSNCSLVIFHLFLRFRTSERKNGTLIESLCYPSVCLFLKEG